MTHSPEQTAALQARAIEILHSRKCSRLTVARELGITERRAELLLINEPLMGQTKGAYSPEKRGALMVKMIARYKATGSPAAAADAAGVARCTAYKWLAAAGLYFAPAWVCPSRKCRKATPEMRAEAMRLFDAGMGLDQAATKAGMASDQLTSALKDRRKYRMAMAVPLTVPCHDF